MVFVDTWAWIALAVRRDQHHSAAKRQHAELVSAGRLYVTTEYVLGELITQLYRLTDADTAEAYIGAVLAGVEAGTYQLERVSPQRFSGAWELRRQFTEKPAISFVDLTSFVVMREMGIQDVFTGDGHFVQVNMGLRLLPANS